MRAPTLLLALVLSACAARQGAPVTPRACGEESAVAPVPIALTGIETRRRSRSGSRYAEVSAMAWRGDDLWLVPQYPERYAREGVPGALLSIPRARIEAYLDGRDRAAITPTRVPFDVGSVATVPGYEGIEAMVIEGDRLWVSIEVQESADRSSSVLVAGTITAEGARLEDRRVSLPPPVDLPNTGYEALLAVPDGLVAIFESNGSTQRQGPTALVAARELGAPAAAIPFPRTEYRVTEVTPLDARGRFWAMNYFFPGDYFLAPGDVPGVDTVERLVEFQWGPAGISRTARAPVPLRRGHHPHNWEGLARLPGRGVLAVTDEWPDTVLALIPVE